MTDAVKLLERIVRNPENMTSDTLLRRDVFRFLRVCEACSGSGMRSLISDCAACDGTGRVRSAGNAGVDSTRGGEQ